MKRSCYIATSPPHLLTPSKITVIPFYEPRMLCIIIEFYWPRVFKAKFSITTIDINKYLRCLKKSSNQINIKLCTSPLLSMSILHVCIFILKKKKRLCVCVSGEGCLATQFLCIYCMRCIHYFLLPYASTQELQYLGNIQVFAFRKAKVYIIYNGNFCLNRLSIKKTPSICK